MHRLVGQNGEDRVADLTTADPVSPPPAAVSAGPSAATGTAVVPPAVKGVAAGLCVVQTGPIVMLVVMSSCVHW
ncbi:MAG: hypothetical protein OEV40_30070 [Acidimicrobiia bacterium]|nr:hypothetical protein [Acidimicrobiia bacterium]